MEKEQRRGPSELTPREVARIATASALEHGRHVPTVIVEGSLRRVARPIENFPETQEGKAQRVFSFGFALGQTQAVGKLKQVFFVSEGWMSAGQRGDRPRTRPSQDPHRQEVLFVFHQAVEPHQTGLLLFEMIRDAAGHLVELREAQESGEADGHVESPLLDAFVAGFDLGMAKLN